MADATVNLTNAGVTAVGASSLILEDDVPMLKRAGRGVKTAAQWCKTHASVFKWLFCAGFWFVVIFTLVALITFYYPAIVIMCRGWAKRAQKKFRDAKRVLGHVQTKDTVAPIYLDSDWSGFLAGKDVERWDDEFQEWRKVDTSTCWTAASNDYCVIRCENTQKNVKTYGKQVPRVHVERENRVDETLWELPPDWDEYYLWHLGPNVSAVCSITAYTVSNHAHDSDGTPCVMPDREMHMAQVDDGKDDEMRLVRKGKVLTTPIIYEDGTPAPPCRDESGAPVTIGDVPLDFDEPKSPVFAPKPGCDETLADKGKPKSQAPEPKHEGDETKKGKTKRGKGVVRGKARQGVGKASVGKGGPTPAEQTERAVVSAAARQAQQEEEDDDFYANESEEEGDYDVGDYDDEDPSAYDRNRSYIKISNRFGSLYPGDESRPALKPKTIACLLCGLPHHVRACPGNKNNRWKLVNLGKPFFAEGVRHAFGTWFVVDTYIWTISTSDGTSSITPTADQLKKGEVVSITTTNQSIIKGVPLVDAGLLEHVESLSSELTGAHEDTGLLICSYVATAYHCARTKKSMWAYAAKKYELLSPNTDGAQQKVWVADDLCLYRRPQDCTIKPAKLPKAPLKPDELPNRVVMVVAILDGRLRFAIGKILSYRMPVGSETCIELHYTASSLASMSGGGIFDLETGCAIGIHQGSLQEGWSNRGRMFSAEMLEFFRAPQRKN
jgi:hypothetical protein